MQEKLSWAHRALCDFKIISESASRNVSYQEDGGCISANLCKNVYQEKAVQALKNIRPP